MDKIITATNAIKKNAKSGMSLIEVMIALAIFAVFATAYSVGHNGSLATSANMQGDLKLKDLAEMQYNLTLLDPPDFSKPVADVKKVTKSFKDYPDYEYTMSYKQIFIPDITKILGEQDDPNDPERQNRKKIMQEFKDNMERLVWQISLEVRDKRNNATFLLSGWTYYAKGQVKFKGF